MTPQCSYMLSLRKGTQVNPAEIHLIISYIVSITNSYMIVFIYIYIHAISATAPSSYRLFRLSGDDHEEEQAHHDGHHDGHHDDREVRAAREDQHAKEDAAQGDA